MQLRPGERRSLYLIVLGAAAIAVIGWRLLWFLTDDAYISFRYISNSILGHGYVWNPPPFRPVEGYSNFLWILILDGLWRLLRIEPPQSCNYLSLGFSLLTLAVVGAMLLRVRLDVKLERYRIPLLGLALLGIATNRTFLTWTSSGLETAMCNFFLVAWVWSSVFARPGDRQYTLWVSVAAACMYLTRPDGLLFLASTIAVVAVASSRVTKSEGKHLAGALPLLIVPAHIVWRRATYGEWLPNSYYAKYTSPWPESGMRYAYSFVLEYALWIWLALLVYLGFMAWRLRPKAAASAGDVPTASPLSDSLNAAREASVQRVAARIVAIVVGTVLVHALYYVVLIGGDHFEYRIFSHLVPLAFVSFVWMLGRASVRPAPAIALIASFVALSWPIPWTHWTATRNLTTREETHMLRAPVAARWPRPFKWYAAAFDRQQAWLIEHYVCVRHQEHKVNCEFLKSLFPSREEGLRLPSDGYPVFAFPAVGVASWVLPHINIIDLHGINDYVIARNPDVYEVRMMAHDRAAPEGYVECFRPNVELLLGRRVEVFARARPLSPEDITACERKWARQVKQEVIP